VDTFRNADRIAKRGLNMTPTVMANRSVKLEEVEKQQLWKDKEGRGAWLLDNTHKR
jgi:hypothetical protein